MGIVGSALDDAEQEVFLVLVRRCRDYDPSYSVRSWLWGISRNVAATQRRRLRRGSSPLPDDVMVEAPRAEDRVAVVQALAQLDEDHRSIWLARQRGCTAAEIATDRCVPLTTVQWRLREAQRRLRDAVGRAGQRCRAFVIWLPRAVSTTVSTGATTVAAGAALAAWLAAALPGDEGAEPTESHVASAVAPQPDPIRRARTQPEPPPDPVIVGDAEVDGIVIVEEPTVKAPPEPVAAQAAPKRQRTRKATRRRKRSVAPRGQVELLDPQVVPG